MSRIPWESKESQNYIRAEYIVTDAVRKELRVFFIQEWNKRYQASLGAWDDTNISGSQLFNLEKSRARPNKRILQSKFQNGNTNEWDCTVLFDAILNSNSIGCSLSTTEKTEINILQKLRNEMNHNTPDKTLNDKDFQTMTTKVENALGALGLSINEVVRIKNLFASFIILPPEPAHEVVYRSDKIHEIREDLEKLRSDNDGKLTYFYITGISGSGKSELARQVCKAISKDFQWLAEGMFIMTLNGKDLDSLFHSYEYFCRRLNCNESVLQIILSSTKPKDEKIKELRSQICNRIKNWKKWWVIVDNVENLELISHLLPLIGNHAWNNGQIILTAKNAEHIPSENLLSKRISLTNGMNKRDCRRLLVLLSTADVNDPLLDKVAEKLGHQPLAMAAAAVYMRQVIDHRPDFSWQGYLDKFQNDQRKLTKQINLQQIDSAIVLSTMAAVLLALEKSAENSKILAHAFTLFSSTSMEPLPLELVVKHIQQHEEDLDAEDIIIAIKQCPLLVILGNRESEICLHPVIHEAVKIFFLQNESEIARSYGNLGDVCKDQGDLEHANDYYHRALEIYVKQLGENHVEVARFYNNLGNLSFDRGKLEDAADNYERALKILLMQLGPSHIEVAASYDLLGIVFNAKGDMKRASSYHQQALEIRLEQLGPDHIDVATSFYNLGIACSGKGDYKQASDCFHKALKIQLAQSEPNHAEVADCYDNLGFVCILKNDLKQANEYYRKALNTRLEYSGRNNVDVGASYHKLSTVFSGEGNKDLGSDYYKRGLKMIVESLEERHAVSVLVPCKARDKFLEKGIFDETCDKDVYTEKLTRLGWVESFEIVNSNEECSEPRLEIVCKLGKVPCTQDIVNIFGKEILPFITYKEDTHDKWFRTHILDENSDIKKEYRERLTRLEWLESFRIVEAKKEGTIEGLLEIVCKLGKPPSTHDIINIFGKEILPSITYKEGTRDKYFKTRILDENYDMKSHYVKELASLEWLKSYKIVDGNNECNKLHLEIVCKRGKVPRTCDIVDIFGEEILPLITYHEDAENTFDHMSLPDDYAERLKSLEWVKSFKIVDANLECHVRHLEIVCKFGKVFHRHDIVQMFGDKILPFIVIHQDSRREWFEDGIFDKNFRMKKYYKKELQNFSWVKDFYVGVTKEPEKSWQIYITHAHDKTPSMLDLKQLFGVNIALFVDFIKGSENPLPPPRLLRRGPVPGDKINPSPDNEDEYWFENGTISLLSHDSINGQAEEKHYAITCYHPCVKMKKVLGCENSPPKFESFVDMHNLLKERFKNESTESVGGRFSVQCTSRIDSIEGVIPECSHDDTQNVFLEGEFFRGLYDDDHDIALIQLSSTDIDCKDNIHYLNQKNIRRKLAENDEIAKMFREVAEPLPVRKIGAITGMTEGELYAIDSAPLYEGSTFEVPYRVTGTRRHPFARPGDSGALVYLVDGNIPFGYLCCDVPTPKTSTEPVPHFGCRNLDESIRKLSNIEPCLEQQHK